jgi:5-(carboxyamino)imidazole ribonucleotide synthase
MAVECFETETGELLVNEIAPRVHNSGHWTQIGCGTDQFEQHIRAIAGWPPGDMALRQAVRMQNLLGDDVHDWPELSERGGAKLVIYGKRQARAGRKMGHVLEPLRR